MARFSLVAVNYNNAEYTKIMVESLLCVIDSIDLIIIVDNASEEADYNKLIEYRDQLETEKLLIVKSEENIGYFPGLNLGMKYLNRKTSTYTIVCNNDLEFNESFFHELDSISLESNVYSLCPSVKTVDGVYQNPSLSRKPSKFRKIFYRLYYSNYILGLLLLKVWRKLGPGKNKATRKDLVSRPIFLGIGAIYVLTPAFFKVNKELIYPSFLYSEELFLSKQIEDSGGIQLYYPKIEVIHAESVSTSNMSNLTKYKLTQQSYHLSKKYFD